MSRLCCSTQKLPFDESLLSISASDMPIPEYNPNLPIDEQTDYLPYDCHKWDIPKNRLKLG